MRSVGNEGTGRRAMKLALGIVALALSLKTALAAVPLWGQCNGIAWTGETGTPPAPYLNAALLIIDW